MQFLLVIKNCIESPDFFVAFSVCNLVSVVRIILKLGRERYPQGRVVCAMFGIHQVTLTTQGQQQSQDEQLRKLYKFCVLVCFLL